MMSCPKCYANRVQKDGNHNGMQRYKCMSCGKRFDYGKYEGNNETIEHFKVRIKKSDRNILTKENYCTPCNEADYKDKKNIQLAHEFYKKTGEYPLLFPQYYCNIPNNIFSDNEHYTDVFVEEHYRDCMENFDLNIRFFSSINYEEFNKYLTKFTKKNKFKEIDDLNELKEKTGIYILVLDKYKQVYIGKSDSYRGMKNRILSHWSRKKEFRRLINGTVENSILSIDSFGALDTTRIFYKELKWHVNIDELEEKLVNEFNPNYRLNRVAGGINSEEFTSIRNLRLISSIQTRDLK